MALLNRFNKIWFSRSSSPINVSDTRPSMEICRFSFFCSASKAKIAAIPCTMLRKLNSFSVSASLPPSIMDISKISLTIDSKNLVETLILLRHSFTFPGFCKLEEAISDIPIIALIGVRKSWDILEIKSDFAWFALFAIAKASCVRICIRLRLSIFRLREICITSWL